VNFLIPSFVVAVLPEVPNALSILKSRGFKLAILSNGTPAMLGAAMKNSGIEDLIEKTFSVEELGIFKPVPRVYQIAVDGLKIKPEEIVFQSSNAWDPAGAAAFGFKVAWVNRFGQSKERLPGRPDVEIQNLIGHTEQDGFMGTRSVPSIQR
jgi:2-haloacid dehalogenase